MAKKAKKAKKKGSPIRDAFLQPMGAAPKEGVSAMRSKMIKGKKGKKC